MIADNNSVTTNDDVKCKNCANNECNGCDNKPIANDDHENKKITRRKSLHLDDFKFENEKFVTRRDSGSPRKMSVKVFKSDEVKLTRSQSTDSNCKPILEEKKVDENDCQSNLGETKVDENDCQTNLKETKNDAV